MGTPSRSEPRHLAASPETGHGIAHLAVVADGVGAADPDRAAATAAAFERACDVASAAFASRPALVALSFFSPEIRDWLLDPRERTAVAVACRRGLAALAEVARAHGARMRVLGRSDRLPEELREAPGGGAPDGARVVAWFLDYSGRDEILRAAARFAGEHPGETLADGDLGAWLDTAGMPDPDLIVCAGGAFEPKDFLLWQGSYAELWHTPEPWSAFDAGALARALGDYAARQRRFGR